MQPDNIKIIMIGTTHPGNIGAAGNSRTYGGSSCLYLQAFETEWKIESHKFNDPL